MSKKQKGYTIITPYWLVALYLQQCMVRLEDLARMLGHRSLDSVMIYYNATATEIASLLD